VTCDGLDNMDLDASIVFEERIVFVTVAADDDLEFTRDENIFFEDELCVAFSTYLFPHHD